MMKSLKTLFSFGLMLISICSLAQDSQTEKDSLTVDDLYIDFAIPDISASNMLSIEKDKVLQPGQLKELAIALTPLIEGQGGELAIEWNPYLAWAKKKRTIITSKNGKQIDQYNKNYFWKSFQLTGGYQSDSTSLRMAAGLKFTPINKGDILANSSFHRSLAYRMRSALSSDVFDSLLFEKLDSLNLPEDCEDAIIDLMHPIKVSEIPDQMLDSAYVYKKILKIVKECSTTLDDQQSKILMELAKMAAEEFDVRKRDLVGLETWLEKKKETFERTKWNAESWQVAAGTVWESRTKRLNDLPVKGFTIFTGYSNKFIDSTYQWTGHIQYKYFNENDIDAETADQTDMIKNSLFLGFMIKKILFNDLDKRLIFQSSYTKKSFYQELEDESNFRFTLGTEFKLAEKFWLEAAVGLQTSTLSNLGTQLVTDTKFAYALGRK